ncbi:hypothetical protein F5Y11DRAFT_194134 [Daldinia sp. FL1419]|nr:hypothetical protein F5Y11DRAFT_194134 [Daldinia sp. FL1419]
MSDSDTNHWSEPASTVGHEHVLDLDTIPDGSGKQTKQLACTRCHTQKLRCVRQPRNGRVCDRCLTANVDCIERKPQRIGRPVDLNPHRHRAGSRAIAGRTPPSSTHSTTASSSTRKPPRHKTPSTGGVSTTSSSTGMPAESDSASTQFPNSATSELGLFTWPTPASNQPSPFAMGTIRQENNDAATTSGAGVQASTLSYLNDPLSNTLDGIPMLGLGDIDPSVFNFPDLSTSVLDHSVTTNAPRIDQNENSNGGSTFDHSLNDPIEKLSKLHLELYQCLALIKSVQEKKMKKLRSKSHRDGGPIDSSWSERLFKTTETFISELGSYVDRISYRINITDRVSESTTLRDWDDVDSPVSPTQLDTATGLMIVSCYMRLLQIFDVVVWVVETYRDADCPGDYVEIKFGNFLPAASKSLHARLMGQYVLHLLDGVSDVTNRVVASRQPYSRAISDIISIEAELKRRILTTLQ